MVWGKFYTFRVTGSPKQKTSLGVLLCTAQGQFLGPVSPIHPGLSRKNFGRSSVLSGVIRLISEPPRTEYSGEPEMSRFLVRSKACYEKFRTVRATSLSQSEKYSPNVLRVQSGEYFSARYNLFIPACHEIM